MKFPGRWEPVDTIIGVFTVAVAALLVAAMVLRITQGEALSQPIADMISGIVLSIISVITLYVGARLRQTADRDDKPDDKPPADPKK